MSSSAIPWRRAESWISTRNKCNTENLEETALSSPARIQDRQRARRRGLRRGLKRGSGHRETQRRRRRLHWSALSAAGSRGLLRNVSPVATRSRTILRSPAPADAAIEPVTVRRSSRKSDSRLMQGGDSQRRTRQGREGPQVSEGQSQLRMRPVPCEPQPSGAQAAKAAPSPLHVWERLFSSRRRGTRPI